MRFYGSPWQPEFHGWAFNLKRGEEIRKVWEKIPDEVDVLITHGPPYGAVQHALGHDGFVHESTLFSCPRTF